jgi:hypothetical protein
MHPILGRKPARNEIRQGLNNRLAEVELTATWEPAMIDVGGLLSQGKSRRVPTVTGFPHLRV